MTLRLVTNEVDKSPALFVGQVISTDTDAVVLAYRQRNAGGDGLREAWTVLCFMPHNAYSKFVVWTAVATPEGWQTAHGDYYTHLTDAVGGYEKRSGI